MEDALRHLIDSLSACKEGKILNLAAEAYKELKDSLEEELLYRFYNFTSEA